MALTCRDAASIVLDPAFRARWTDRAHVAFVAEAAKQFACISDGMFGDLEYDIERLFPAQGLNLVPEVEFLVNLCSSTVCESLWPQTYGRLARVLTTLQPNLPPQEAALRCLHHTDPLARAAAVCALVPDVLQPRVMRALLVHHESEHTEEAQARICLAFRRAATSPQGRTLLLDALATARGALAENLVHVLSCHLHEHPVEQALCALLEAALPATTPAVQAAMIYLAPLAARPTVLDAFIACLEHRNAAVRLRALEVLAAQSRHPAVAAHLLQRCNDSQEDVVTEAMIILNRVGPPDYPRLMHRGPYCNHDKRDMYVRERARFDTGFRAYLLAEIHKDTDPSRPRVVDPSLREDAVNILCAAVDEPEVQRAFVDALWHPRQLLLAEVSLEAITRALTSRAADASLQAYFVRKLAGSPAGRRLIKKHPPQHAATPHAILMAYLRSPEYFIFAKDARRKNVARRKDVARHLLAELPGPVDLQWTRLQLLGVNHHFDAHDILSTLVVVGGAAEAPLFLDFLNVEPSNARLDYLQRAVIKQLGRSPFIEMRTVQDALIAQLVNPPQRTWNGSYADLQGPIRDREARIEAIMEALAPIAHLDHVLDALFNQLVSRETQGASEYRLIPRDRKLPSGDKPFPFATRWRLAHALIPHAHHKKVQDILLPWRTDESDPRLVALLTPPLLHLIDTLHPETAAALAYEVVSDRYPSWQTVIHRFG